jgi:hypothetical protein
MIPVFLSIDLDYWAHGRKHQCDVFFKKVYALGLPIHAAYEHDHLLDVINSSQCTTLINVDFHSDLCDTPAEGWELSDLNEGTWGNFVSWRERGTFIWRYPSSLCLKPGNGYCHNDVNPFEKPASGWREARKRQGVAGIPWDSIKAVGVCLSPDWIGRTSVIREPIDRLGMQDWLDLDEIGLCLSGVTVKIVQSREKNTHKMRKMLAKRQGRGRIK